MKNQKTWGVFLLHRQTVFHPYQIYKIYNGGKTGDYHELLRCLVLISACSLFVSSSLFLVSERSCFMLKHIMDCSLFPVALQKKVKHHGQHKWQSGRRSAWCQGPSLRQWQQFQRPRTQQQDGGQHRWPQHLQHAWTRIEGMQIIILKHICLPHHFLRFESFIFSKQLIFEIYMFTTFRHQERKNSPQIWMIWLKLGLRLAPLWSAGPEVGRRSTLLVLLITGTQRYR